MTSDSETAQVLSEVHDGVCTITLNRPRQLNALGLAAADQLLAAVRAAEAQPEVRTVILRGAGKGFCAGGDVHAMAEAEEASGARVRTRLLLRSALNRDLVQTLPTESRTIALQSGVPAAQALISEFVAR